MAQDEGPRADKGSLDVSNASIARSQPWPGLSPTLKLRTRPKNAWRPTDATHRSVSDFRQASLAWDRSTACPSAKAMKSEVGRRLSLIKTPRRMFETVQNGGVKWRPIPRVDFVLRQPAEAPTVAVLADKIIGVVAARSNNLCIGAQTPDRVSHRTVVRLIR
jgi:hypothetical protein